jgi:hypothetical protein
MFYMLFFIHAVDQDVVYEHHYELIQILHEHFFIKYTK